MKTRTKSAHLPNLTKLSTSRSSSRLPTMGNSTIDAASSLFGPRKHVMLTYSKSRPLQFLKKSHFLSPDTPQTSTPDSLQFTSTKRQETKEDNKSKTFASNGATNVETPLSEGDSQLKPPSSANKIVRPVLAFKDISNIPIEKTLSTVQCTPSRQQETETTQPERTSKLSKAKRKINSKKGAKSGNSKRRKRLDMNRLLQPQNNSKESKTTSLASRKHSDVKNSKQERQSTYNSPLVVRPHTLKTSQIANREEIIPEEIEQDKNSSIQSNQQQLSSVIMVKHKKQQISSKDCEQRQKTCNSTKYQCSQGRVGKHKVAKITKNVPSGSSQQRPSSANNYLSQESTNYSIKSMSTETNAKTRSVVQSQTNTRTSQSMSLCSMIEEENENKEIVSERLQHKNSTFNEGVDRVELADYFTDLLSTIGEDRNIESKEKNKADRLESLTIKDQDYTIKQPEETSPKSSTPIDNGKRLHIEEPGISPITQDNGTPDLKPDSQDMKEAQMLPKKTSFKEEAASTRKNLKEKPVQVKISKRNSFNNREGSVESARKKVKQSPKNIHDVEQQKKTSLKEINTIKHSGTKVTANTTNASLPLQTSMCIEDDSDNDNITPELVPPNMNQYSSSKRKLQYSDMPYRPNVEQCFLLDFPVSLKKPGKIWMKKPHKNPRIQSTVLEPHSFAPDILTKVYHAKKEKLYNCNYTF